MQYCTIVFFLSFASRSYVINRRKQPDFSFAFRRPSVLNPHQYFLMKPHRFHFRGLLGFITALVVCTDTTQGDTIGFFYALEADLQGLKSMAREMGQSETVGSRSIQRLQLGPHSIYAIKMGSGAVETAASAQALLTRHPCDWAFSIGPAGALSDIVQTGSWFRVTRVMAWQRENTDLAWDTDWSRFPIADPPAPLHITTSLSVASGEQFISTASDRDRLQATTQADAVDMNSFGLALVCADHNVPLFAWKIISDRADENASEVFRAFVSGYSGEGGRALAKIIQALPANPNDPSSYPAIRDLLNDPRARQSTPAPLPPPH